MKLAIDLHIHSGLSPCADNSMSPNNIINMAKIKGLDAIAITDHNSTKNIPTFISLAEKKNIICIPGVEVTTKEEVHLLAYFKDLDSVIKFQEIIDKNLQNKKNDCSLFGNQLLYNEKDEILGEYDILLINSLRLSLEEIIAEIRNLKGVPIPAHINRNRYSIISNLGFISPELKINTVEICAQNDMNLIEKYCTNFDSYGKIITSDAHSLGQILEKEFFIEVENNSIESILSVIDNIKK